MRYFFPLLLAAFSSLTLAACTTTNINAPQPNLQSINLGHPSCAFDCNTTQTATQSIGDGDVQGATVSNQRSTTRQGATP
jgi:hypothetical protein